MKVGTLTTNKMNNPLQTILFLVRDWEESDSFGYASGKIFLKQIFESYQLSGNKELQTKIQSSYDNVTAFVLPNPGKNIENVFNHGQLSMVCQSFKDQLKNIIEELLKPENLITKKVGAYDVKASELFEYMEAYLEVFQTTKTPTAELFSKITVDIQMKLFVKECIVSLIENLYKTKIDDPDVVDAIKDETVKRFKSKITIGVSLIKNEFLNDLKMQIKEQVSNWRFNLDKALPGKPITLLSFANNKVLVDHTALSDVLTAYSDLKKRKLVVIAITGIVGTERTLLLNYCLRYMYANVCMILLTFD